MVGIPEVLQTLSESGTESQHPIYLVSSRVPGSGSTTTAHMLAQALGDKYEMEPFFVSIGAEIRKLQSSTGEADLRKNEDAGPTPRDPNMFDVQFYDAALDHKISVVEGKKATSTGRKIIGDKRNTVTIDLVAPPLVSAVRVMRREGHDIDSVIRNPGSLLEYMAKLQERTAFLEAMQSTSSDLPPAIDSSTFDTSRMCPQEIVGEILGVRDWEKSVPQWEIEALKKVESRLFQLSRVVSSHPLDRTHFEHNHGRLGYQIDLLDHNKNPYAMAGLRSSVHTALVHSMFSIMLKTTPRFFRRELATQDNNAIFPRQSSEHIVDQMSQAWTPEYYKIANVWPTLKVLLKDKRVLDPFAGAGTLMTTLAARGIPTSIVYGDWCYPGGHMLQNTEYKYDPRMNIAMTSALFDELPSWYKPLCDKTIMGYVASDARELPYPDNTFDYIAGDPPYGKNLKEGDLELFLTMLPELNRVSKFGGIYLFPKNWLPNLDEKGVVYETLYDDLSNRQSNLPVSVILISKLVDCSRKGTIV